MIYVTLMQILQKLILARSVLLLERLSDWSTGTMKQYPCVKSRKILLGECFARHTSSRKTLKQPCGYQPCFLLPTIDMTDPQLLTT